MRIMAGGQSNFRCFCDNCWARSPLEWIMCFQQEFWEAKERDWRRLSATSIQTLQKYNLHITQVGSFNQTSLTKHKTVLPTKKGIVMGLGVKNHYITGREIICLLLFLRTPTQCPWLLFSAGMCTVKNAGCGLWWGSWLLSCWLTAFFLSSQILHSRLPQGRVLFALF